MAPERATSAARRAVSSLDGRIEASTGRGLDVLWEYRDRGVLDERHAHLVDEHRELVKAETGVAFYLKLIHRLSGGEFTIDSALFERIGRAVEQLAQTTKTRDAAIERVIAALAPVESTAATALPPGGGPVPERDQALLLSLASGAKLYEHLLTGRKSVTTASGTRIPYAELQRLEDSGLVSRDTGRPVHAGQPVTLTATGRAALLAAPRRPAPAGTPAPRPGAWPTSAAPRR
ncbi:hypothetical protein [Streptomyces sp. NPDC046860]|uniref:hypothetical protein n=1 Tax=Streptomyces sp. NPDC046860 TaxID=3154495 RepID=UPI0033E93EA2